MTHAIGSTYIEGLGTYQYDQAVYDYLMQDGQRTRASLVSEVIQRTGDDHGDGYRTLIRKLRKSQLAAMVAEWGVHPARARLDVEPRLSWLEITDAGRARLAQHLRAGLTQTSDAALRGFVASFVESLEG
jgi:hypothetical protein